MSFMSRWRQIVLTFCTSCLLFSLALRVHVENACVQEKCFICFVSFFTAWSEIFRTWCKHPSSSIYTLNCFTWFTCMRILEFLHTHADYLFTKHTHREEEMLQAINLLNVHPPCLHSAFTRGNQCRALVSWISGDIRPTSIHLMLLSQPAFLLPLDTQPFTRTAHRTFTPIMS